MKFVTGDPFGRFVIQGYAYLEAHGLRQTLRKNPRPEYGPKEHEVAPAAGPGVPVYVSKFKRAPEPESEQPSAFDVAFTDESFAQRPLGSGPGWWRR